MTTDITALTTTTETQIPTPGYRTSTERPSPSIGDQVLFTLDEGHRIGETRPGVIVRTFAGLAGKANLIVFTDGYNDFPTSHPGSSGVLWKTSVSYSETGERGTWRYATDGIAMSMPG